MEHLTGTVEAFSITNAKPEYDNHLTLIEDIKKQAGLLAYHTLMHDLFNKAKR